MAREKVKKRKHKDFNIENVDVEKKQTKKHHAYDEEDKCNISVTEDMEEKMKMKKGKKEKGKGKNLNSCGDVFDDQEREPSLSDNEFLLNALASDTSSGSSDVDDGEKSSKPKKTQSLLYWMRKPLDIDTFEECSLNHLPFLDPRLEDALRKMGFQSLFPVQVAVWQTTVGPGGFGRDICVNAPTGSGKTLSYALPIVQMLSVRKIRCLRALVVVPTRDLAMQVKAVFDAIAPAVGLNVGLAVGQSSIEQEISNLIKRPKFKMGMTFDPEDRLLGIQSAVDILVATPGRLVDHINRTKGFSLEHLHYLVVDEVDRLVREAYQFWLPTVLQLAHSRKQGLLEQARTPSCTISSLKTTRRCGVERGFKGNMYPRLVKMIFSATLTKDPSKLNQLDLHHALYLTSGYRRYSFPKKLESRMLVCNTKLKFLNLAALLEDLKGEKCLVFTPSVELTHRLSTSLNLLGCLPMKISEYSRLQNQSVRSQRLKDFREGRIDVLVSSDAMTRGMDVEGVKNVINYDMPPYIKNYIHRAGRTARAGQAGRCFTLLRQDEVKRFRKMLDKVGINSCAVHNLPAENLQKLEPLCDAAIRKLGEVVGSEAQ